VSSRTARAIQRNPVSKKKKKKEKEKRKKKFNPLMPRQHSGNKVREQERHALGGDARGTWEELQGNQVPGTEPQKGTLKTRLL
jgi:hypothetical protein